MPSTQDIVQKLWNLCNVLRDDGITYLQYVTELTYLLFLKMAKETGTEDQLPKGHRWGDLAKRDGLEQLDFYRTLLIHLGSHGSTRVQEIARMLSGESDSRAALNHARELLGQRRPARAEPSNPSRGRRVRSFP